MDGTTSGVGAASGAGIAYGAGAASDTDDSNINLDKFKKSVCQIVCSRRETNPFTPYLIPDCIEVSGSGFVYDIDRGIILTNAHVVSNSVHIYALFQNFGRRHFVLNLISICVEKDVALCQLNEESIELLKGDYGSEDINLKFTSETKLHSSNEVYAVGFPLGERNLKISKGIISGFYDNNNREDSKILGDEDSPTFIQVDAPINPGNSGGPLIDKKGEVIGINSAGILFASNIGFVIGVKTIFSVLTELLKPLLNNKMSTPNIVKIARYSFTFNPINQDMKDKYSLNSVLSGIHINNVYENSSFYGILQEKDILSQIQYTENNGNKITLKIEDDGTITINNNNSLLNIDSNKFIIKQVFDFIQNGIDLSLTVYRQHNIKKVLNCKFIKKDTYFNHELLSEFEKFPYVICFGMCIGELTLNHVQSFDNSDNLKKYIEGKNRLKKFLIINKIFPGTEIYRNNFFKSGMILKLVNGKEVSNLKQLGEAVSTNGNKIELVSDNNITIIIDRNKFKKENNEIYDQILGKGFKCIKIE